MYVDTSLGQEEFVLYYVRKYLKADGYFRFKAQKKLFLSSKNKQANLRWAKEHLGWTMEDWYRVIWTDEATFETGLDTRKHGTAMESRQDWEIFYWHLGRHYSGFKGACLLHQSILKELGLPFFKCCVEERG